MTIPPLALPAERRALAKLIIDLILLSNESIHWPANVGDGETDANLTLVLAAVLLGHAEGNGSTQTEIATRVNMPRGSVARRLNVLVERAVIGRTNDGRYFLEARRATAVPMRQQYSRALSEAISVLGPYVASISDASISDE
jgi:hypothetical protein